LKRKIDKAIDKLALSQEQTQMLKGMNEQLLQKADELVETKLKQALDKIDEYAKLTLDLLEENKQLTDIVNRLTQIVNDTLIKTDNKFDKIAKVLEIAFTNDKDLVRNGYAQAIEKVLEQAQPLVNEVLANVEE
jgi:ABC-type transporter Mla subunit MlaD